MKNETANVFQLKLWLDDTHLNGKLLCDNPLDASFQVEERNHIIKQQYWGGYSRHNQIVQVKTDSRGKQSEKLLVENHAILMYRPFLETI